MNVSYYVLYLVAKEHREMNECSTFSRGVHYPQWWHWCNCGWRNIFMLQLSIFPSFGPGTNQCFLYTPADIGHFWWEGKPRTRPGPPIYRIMMGQLKWTCWEHQAGDRFHFLIVESLSKKYHGRGLLYLPCCPASKVEYSSLLSSSPSLYNHIFPLMIPMNSQPPGMLSSQVMYSPMQSFHFVCPTFLFFT